MSSERIPCLPNACPPNASVGETSKGRAAAAAVGLLAAASGNLASAEIMVDRTVGPSSGTGFDVLFDTVYGATQLVSISAGSVYTGEGGTFDISAIFSDNTTQSLFSTTIGASDSTESLSSITFNTFSGFASPQDVVGLRFETTDFGIPLICELPAATTVTFAVPEPSTGLLLAFGMVLLVACRRRISGAVQPGASEAVDQFV